MIKLTKSRVVMLENMLVPTKMVSFVKDADYLLLTKDAETRLQFLENLGVDSIIIDRMGTEIEEDQVFERKSFNIEVPDVPIRREMGYHHRL